MEGKGLTESDMLEFVYKSDESSSDSSNDSISSSDNETDNAAEADEVINDDSDDEEISHQAFMWETKDNYTGHREVFNCDFGSRFGTENVSDIVECFSFLQRNKTNC